jgi:hypothetical protein
MATMSLAVRSSCSMRGMPLRAAARTSAPTRRGLVVVADSRKAVVVLTGTAGVAGEVVFTQDGNGARSAPPAPPRPAPLCGARSSGACVGLCALTFTPPAAARPHVRHWQDHWP